MTSIDTINVAKAIANINASNTVIGTTPFRTGVSQPPLSHLFYYSSIIPYIRSRNNEYFMMKYASIMPLFAADSPIIK